MTTIQVYFDSGIQAFNCNNDIASWRSSEINRGTVHQVVKKKCGRHGLVKEDYLENQGRTLWGRFKRSPKEHARKSGGGAAGGKERAFQVEQMAYLCHVYGLDLHSVHKIQWRKW